MRHMAPELQVTRSAAPALLCLLCLLCPLHACSDSPGDDATSEITLNELLALSDTQSDWVELYNPSGADVSLAGFELRDSSNAWIFGDATIKARGFLKVTCDGTGLAGRASFKLSSSGESVTLLDASGQTVDTVTFPKMARDVSWGRYPDGTGSWSYLQQPTPAAANISGALTDGGTLDAGADAGPTSAPCKTGAGCLSGVCHKFVCVSSYPNKTGGACPGNGACLSMVCVEAICVAGSSPVGSTCLYAEECLDGACTAGKCAVGKTPDSGAALDGGAAADSEPAG